MQKVEIIADIGSNFRGKLELALKAVEAAKEVGCDVVKFQSYDFFELYGMDGTAPHATPRGWLTELAAHAEKVGIEFMCTAFSPGGVEYVDRYVKRHKVASSEMLHWQILDAVNTTGKPALISTGGHNGGDVSWLTSHLMSYGDWRRFTLLECAASYPAAIDQHNLGVLSHWRRLGFGVGLSDHTQDPYLATTAIGAGASVIEKHFDPFDEMLPTPDGPASMNRLHLAYFISELREAEAGMGDKKSARHQPEMALRWRRRLIVTKPVKPGDTFRLDENFGLYRSLKDDTKGLPCWLAEEVDGKPALTALEPGDAIGPKDFEQLPCGRIPSN